MKVLVTESSELVGFLDQQGTRQGGLVVSPRAVGDGYRRLLDRIWKQSDRVAQPASRARRVGKGAISRSELE